MRNVVKFGGSSLASAEQFKKVGAIIRADKERKFVVPSAPGKRSSDDTKVTDMLYACYDLAEQGKDFKKELQAIHDRYQEIIDGLGLELSLDEHRSSVEIKATVSCDGRTGVEMEALTAVSTAALTVYDMCKAVQKDMTITDIRLLSKTGGIHGDYKREDESWRIQQR